VCETYQYADTGFTKLDPSETNFRSVFAKIMEDAKEAKPWFGIEQEYTLFEHTGTNSKWPLGWPKGGFPGPQGAYYCSVGSANCFGRPVMEAHYQACLHAGVQISGTNAEVMPGQWYFFFFFLREFQVGPCEGLKIGDDMICARYLLSRVAEDFNLVVSFEPKPILGNWNGSGCHTNYSTLQMRNEGGLKVILEAVEKLRKRHAEHIEVYGENVNRLTGFHETSSITKFSYGIGNRGASIRIPTDVARDKKGYLEDRRPASDIDPYLVGAIVVDTTVLDSAHVHTIIASHEKFSKHISENRRSR
jgi:glutamine synthetase